MTMLADGLLDDPAGAFCRDNHVALRGSGAGPLAGLTMGVKDLFHVGNHRTGFGNPDWLASHPPATETAVAVRMLLDAGADMVGKTHTDELAYSLSGENVHYGTPLNPRCPERVPGGSSCGSVSAVAAELVDFALGSDCGGSVRLPASYCGVLGMRPSLSHITAREEVVTLLNSLHLPLSENGKRRAAARAEWYSVMDQPLQVHDVIA